MLTFIAYGLMPIQIFAFALSGYLIGSWNNDQEIKFTATLVFGFTGICSVLVSLALGANNWDSKIPPNIEGMLGISVGTIIITIIITIIHYIRSFIDVKKTVESRVKQEIKKRELENEIILKNEGIL